MVLSYGRHLKGELLRPLWGSQVPRSAKTVNQEEEGAILSSQIQAEKADPGPSLLGSE